MPQTHHFNHHRPPFTHSVPATCHITHFCTQHRSFPNFIPKSVSPFFQMRSSKRTREDEDMQIRVATGEPLAADSFVLRAHSTCARALPADAAVWDVSGLLYEGQPFSRETVACWLQCVCSAVHGDDEKLEFASLQQLRTALGLAQVLAFAHAVGSFKGVCQAACRHLQDLDFVVQLPQQVLKLPSAGCVYWFGHEGLMQFSLRPPVPEGEWGYVHSDAPLASHEQKEAVQQQVAKQTAALLQLGHMLRLQPLHKALHHFILLNGEPGGRRLLSDVAGLVFTDAVLDAAVGSSSALSREAYINSVMSQPCSLTWPGAMGDGSLLEPIERPTYEAYRGLVFRAKLLQDFAGGKAGATVKVLLDLFGGEYHAGTITLQHEQHQQNEESEDGSVTLPVQLLLGCSFEAGTTLESFLSRT